MLIFFFTVKVIKHWNKFPIPHQRCGGAIIPGDVQEVSGSGTEWCSLVA